MLRRRLHAVRGALCAIALALVASTQAAYPQTTGAKNNLFIPLAGARVALGDKREAAKADDHDTARVLGYARVDTTMLDKDTLTLNLGTGRTLEATRTRLDVHPDGSKTWVGTVAGSGNPVTLVSRNGQITGSISEGDRIISVRSADVSGVHAISQLDTRALPKEEPPSFAKTSKRSAANFDVRVSGVSADSRAAQGTPTITVLVGYTAAVKRARPDVTGLVTLAEAETNESYRRSGVHAKLKVVRTMQSSVRENGSFDDDLRKFVSDPAMKKARKAAKASVAVLLIADGEFCGLADAILARPETAYAVVYYDCATGYYSFGHEIGHLLGARHDEAHDGDDMKHPSHGFQHPHQRPDLAWRTIMAYSCGPDTPCDRRLQNWSNPDVKFNGIPTGTRRLNNNAQILNQTAALIASYGSKL